MKRRITHMLLSKFTALAVLTSFAVCERTFAEPAAAPASAAYSREAYGIAAMITKDAEAFSAHYRLGELWTKVSNSNWAKTLLALPALQKEHDFQQAMQQWNSPQALKGREIIGSLLGNEFAVVMPAGFTDKFTPWTDFAAEAQGMQFQRAFMTAMGGGVPPDSRALFREAAPGLIKALSKCEVPPLFFAFKAAKSKADIDGALGMLVENARQGVPPGIEFGKFTLAGKYEFQNVVVDAAKLINEKQSAIIEGQLTQMLGDEAKAKEAVASLKTKKIEVATGWVGEYLILSLGTDHSHLKFAAGEADSLLSIPAVARRAAEYAGKQPIGFGYASAATQEKIYGKLEFANAFKEITEELSTLLKPDHIAAMQADVKKFEAQAQALYNQKFDPMVTVSYCDSGIRAESFGGAQVTAFATNKPLAFASLLTPATLFFADGRSNPANNGKLSDLLENGVLMLWGWYDKFGRTMIPDDERGGAAMAEAMVVPIVKDLWASSRKLAASLGDETALVLDMNGAMPAIPNLPPNVAPGKVPRVAWVAELKDRAGVSEAWKGFNKVLKQMLALVPEGTNIPEPMMKKEGDVELHFIQPPIPTGDFLPHIGITKDRWIISSSPSFTKEIASKSPASGVSPLGSEMRLQLPALCDFADAWLKIFEKDPAFFFGQHDGAEFIELRPTFDGIVKLVRSIQSLEWRIFSEGSEARGSFHLKLEDVK